MTGVDVLLRGTAPWLLVGHDRRRIRQARTAVDGAGGRVAVLAGRRMRAPAGLHAEFAAALEFPDYYGHNWAALDECLADLGWLPAPGYLLLVQDGDQLLADAPDERVGLLADLLAGVAAGWSTAPDRPAVPFHVLLACGSAGAQAATVQRWAGAGATLTPL